MDRYSETVTLAIQNKEKRKYAITTGEKGGSNQLQKNFISVLSVEAQFDKNKLKLNISKNRFNNICNNYVVFSKILNKMLYTSLI